MAWWLWLILSLILGIIEVTTTTFVLMWIGIAGVVTAILGFFAPILWLQVAVFAVVSMVLLILTRAMVRRWRTGAATIAAPADRMLGKTGVVVVVPEEDKLGTARIAGELWSIVARDLVAEGDRVVVVHADSSVLQVRRWRDESNS